MKIVEQVKSLVEVFGTEYPWILFVAIVLLPALGFPVSVLLVLAGVVWGATPLTCLVALLAIVLNVICSHLAAAGVAKPLINRVFGDRFKKWQDLEPSGHLRIALVLRVTPGVPLCVQNYVISMIGIPLSTSLLVALPVTGLYVCGFVLTGGAVFEGKIGLLVTGVSLLFVAVVLVRWLRRRVGGMPSEVV